MSKAMQDLMERLGRVEKELELLRMANESLHRANGYAAQAAIQTASWVVGLSELLKQEGILSGEAIAEKVRANMDDLAAVLKAKDN